MKQFLLIIISTFLFNVGLSAQVDVTFQVNISDKTDFYTGGSVWVYMDADWNEYYTMTDDDQDGIYTYTVSKAEGTDITYSYSYQNGADEWNDYVVESVPEACADGNGFRTLTVPANNITLPAVYYGSCSDDISANFRVNMSDIGDLTGDVYFVWWDDNAQTDVWETMSLTDNDIYIFTKSGLTLSQIIYYYFAYNESGSYETVPAACDAGDGYRGFTPTMGYEQLPAYMFSSCDEQPPAPNVMVTFSVDMSQTTVINNDVQVVIKNPWIWTSLVDQGNGIWSATVELAPNQTYPYTFVNGGQDYWDGEESITGDCNKGTASAPERHVEVIEDNITLPTVIFGTCDEATVLSEIIGSNIKVYPLPADEMLHITSDEIIEYAEILSISGALLQKSKINKKQAGIETASLDNGLYLLKVKMPNRQQTRKIIIQH